VTKPPRISSTFAILDIERGRKALAKHLDRHGPVRVLIEAVITGPYGYDDGVSIEFCADVVSVEVVG
jgi:hypothetical protein